MPRDAPGVPIDRVENPQSSAVSSIIRRSAIESFSSVGDRGKASRVQVSSTSFSFSSTTCNLLRSRSAGDSVYRLNASCPVNGNRFTHRQLVEEEIDDAPLLYSLSPLVYLPGFGHGGRSNARFAASNAAHERWQRESSLRRHTKSRSRTTRSCEASHSPRPPVRSKTAGPPRNRTSISCRRAVSTTLAR